MWTVKFWMSAGERAAKTVAQTLTAALTAGGVGLLSVGWKQALVTAGLAGVASVLSSVASARVGDSSSPSLVTGDSR